MPLRKKVPSLFDLSTREIARSLHYHSLIFFFSNKFDERVNIDYHFIRGALLQIVCEAALVNPWLLGKLICNKLMEQLKYINDYEKANSCTPLKDLMAFLFGGETENFVDVNYMLKFIFSECLQCFNHLFDGKFTIPNELFTIMSQCKGLQILRMSSVDFSKQCLMKFLDCCAKIRVVVLSDIACNDMMVKKILESCPQLQKLAVEGLDVTDKSFFYLCGHYTKSTEPTIHFSPYKTCVEFVKQVKDWVSPNLFSLCAEPERCCRRGRKLTSIQIRKTSITKEGMACALQHCNLLTKVTEKNKYPWFDLLNSINLLKNALKSKGKPHLKLKLNKIDFSGGYIPRDVVRNTIKWCPGVTTVIFDPSTIDKLFFTYRIPQLRNVLLTSSPSTIANTEEYLNFFDTKGPKISKICMTFRHNKNIHLRELHAILQKCTNLKYLTLQKLKICCNNSDLEPAVPLCIEQLVSIQIEDVEAKNLPAQRYLQNLLIKAKNLQILTLTDGVVKKALMLALKQNEFPFLKKIQFLKVNLKNISLEKLSECENQLQIIQLIRCKYVEEFIQLHKEAAYKNNFHLEILGLKKN